MHNNRTFFFANKATDTNWNILETLRINILSKCSQNAHRSGNSIPSNLFQDNKPKYREKTYMQRLRNYS